MRPIVIKHPGALHKSLGVPQGKGISLAQLQQAKGSSDPTLAKRANFALNARGWRKVGRKAKPDVENTEGMPDSEMMGG